MTDSGRGVPKNFSERPEFALLWQRRAADIADSKRQQWNTAYYFGAVLSLLVAAAFGMNACSRHVGIILGIVAILAGIGSGTVIFSLQKSIKLRRKYLRRLVDRLAKDFEAYQWPQNEKPNDPVYFLLLIAVIVGTGLTLFLIWERCGFSTL